jgi:hypothetical protein
LLFCSWASVAAVLSSCIVLAKSSGINQAP